MVEIVELEKVCQSQAASLAAAQGALSLIERGFSRYGHSWDLPAIAAFEGPECVGVLLVKIDEHDQTANVDLAWCRRDRPSALLALLVRLRRWCSSKSVKEVYFTAHAGNSAMAKAADAVGAEIVKTTYRVAL